MGNYEEREIAALIHGRYLVDPGSRREPGRPLLIGFHGYAENAERHLEMLRRIPGVDDWVVCSVGALHRFYNTKTGDVIASWMTRQQREQAIIDNVRYVSGVIAAVRREEEASGVLVTVGFSQGVAMAYRAAMRAGYTCHGVIALAGDVPPEIAETEAPFFPPVLIGRGTADTWYTEDKMEQDLAVLGKKGVAVESCIFEGGHEWTDELCERAGAFLAEVSQRRLAAVPSAD